jgi:hypothetical protein
VSRALLVGTLLSVAVLAYVLYPLFGLSKGGARAAVANAKGARAVTDEEIEAAIRSYRETHVIGGITCPVCGPRPEPDAVFCSACGRRFDGAAAGP